MGEGKESKEQKTATDRNIEYKREINCGNERTRETERHTEKERARVRKERDYVAASLLAKH